MDNTNQTAQQASISQFCQQITNAFIPSAEGDRQVSKATLSEMPRNAVSGKEYNNLNAIMLWTAFREKHFDSHEWATFKQWSAQNETIRKGEKGTLLTCFETVDKEAGGTTRTILVMQFYHVFNRSQLTVKTK